MSIIIHGAADLPPGGSDGQVLTKTASGEAWQDIPAELPDSGTTGQILTKTDEGTAWQDAPAIPSKTSDLTNDSGFITGYTETDPTVPSWAKSATKPTYTAAEVGAATSSHGHALTDSSITGVLPLTKGGLGQTTAPLGLYALINGSTALTSTGISTSDYIPIGDISAATGKKITLANLKTALGGGVVTGTYTGNASRTSETMQSITLGFQPSFVIAWNAIYGVFWYYFDETDDTGDRYRESEQRMAFAINGHPGVHDYYDTDPILQITTTGFQVCNMQYSYSNSSNTSYRDYNAYMNYTGETYCYIAGR